MAKESEKLDIEDIKDPLDEVDSDKEVDLEEAVEEEPEAKEETAEEVAEEKPEDEVPDELEKAVAEEPKEPKAEEKKKEKAKKDKKAFPWKIVAIIVITVLVTAALIMGGVFLYQKYWAPKEETKTEAPNNNVQINVEKNIKVTGKVVFVTANDGLNLRKEPVSTAEKLTTIPYGTKLDVLATQGTWYQTTYNNLTGWVDGAYTAAENPLVYKNTKYQFQITFPTTWAAYKVFEGGASEVSMYYFGLPTTDKAWTEANVDSGYASLMAVTVYSKAQYEALKAEGGMIGEPAATKGDYVILASSGQANPADLNSQYTQVKDIIKTIKFY